MVNLELGGFLKCEIFATYSVKRNAVFLQDGWRY